MAQILGVPLGCLPQPLPPAANDGKSAAGAAALPAGLPIRAMMGDSLAAPYGHGISALGVVKVTYGTGTQLMVLTEGRACSTHGLSGTSPEPIGRSWRAALGRLRHRTLTGMPRATARAFTSSPDAGRRNALWAQ
jgi:sugar (pentulose or hexulose) kinase